MSQLHPVYVCIGYRSGELPQGDGIVAGYGRSDRAAYQDAKRQGDQQALPLVYYFHRSNGDKVPVRQLDVTTGTTARQRAAKRWRYFRKG